MFSLPRSGASALFRCMAKIQRPEMLYAMEEMALEIIQLHPEYQRVLEMPERFQHKMICPKWAISILSLHMSMHVAVKEQLSIDQPSGVASVLATATKNR